MTVNVDLDTGSIPSGGVSCGNYANEVCVSVTVCALDGVTCKTIPNILLDTGSYGLRVFDNLLPSGLTPISSGGSTLSECVLFGDGSSEFGPVEYAYVQLGGEPMVAVPILAINSTYGTPPAACTNSQSSPDISPTQAGFNGILGVGLWAQDCGNGLYNSSSDGTADCTTDSANGQYFTCTGGNCGCGATVAMQAQVKNPVASLPSDNNGVILDFSSTNPGATGATNATGTLYLGIDTQANNASTGFTAMPADPGASEFFTKFNAYSSSTYIPAFIDSGSSIFFMPTVSGLTDCSVSHGSGWSGIFCPGSNTAESAVLWDVNLGASQSVSFHIGNGYSLFNSASNVFNNLGALSGTGAGAYFDWGLPFFFGRKVIVGIKGVNDTGGALGEGPYWAL